jgi:hypothetical protein
MSTSPVVVCAARSCSTPRISLLPQRIAALQYDTNTNSTLFTAFYQQQQPFM